MNFVSSMCIYEAQTASVSHDSPCGAFWIATKFVLYCTVLIYTIKTVQYNTADFNIQKITGNIRFLTKMLQFLPFVGIYHQNKSHRLRNNDYPHKLFYENEHSWMSICGLKQEIRTAYSAYARHTEIAARAPPLTQHRQWTWCPRLRQLSLISHVIQTIHPLHILSRR